MRGVVLDGQGGGHLHVVDQVLQTGHSGLREVDQPVPDPPLESGVVGAAIAPGSVPPRLECVGVDEGDDLRGVVRLARFHRRERDEGVLGRPGQQRGGLAWEVVVIEVPADPHIPTGHPDAARVVAQPQVGGDGRGAGSDPPDRVAQAGGGRPHRPVGRQQIEEGHGSARARDHHRRAMDPLLRDGAAAIQYPDPDRPPVLHEDLLHVLGNPHGTSGPFDAFLEGPGNAGAAALGKPGAVQVVPDDHRVRGEGAERRRQPVVAPLAGQQGPEPGGAETSLQVALRGSERHPARDPLDAPQQWRDGARHHVFDEIEGVPPVDVADVAEISANGAGLGGEGFDEFPLVLGGIGGRGEVDARVDETVVGIRYAVPHQFVTR